MARKRSIETIDKDISKLDSRENSLMSELEKVRTEKDKLITERNEILTQQRRENTDKIGEMIYAAFGEDIPAEVFKEKLELILQNKEIKNLVLKENAAANHIGADNNSDTVSSEISFDNDTKKEAC